MERTTFGGWFYDGIRSVKVSIYDPSHKRLRLYFSNCEAKGARTVPVWWGDIHAALLDTSKDRRLIHGRHLIHSPPALGLFLRLWGKGAPIYDVRREGGRGLRNAGNLRTNSIDFADKGIGEQKISKFCWRHVWKPPKIDALSTCQFWRRDRGHNDGERSHNEHLNCRSYKGAKCTVCLNSV